MLQLKLIEWSEDIKWLLFYLNVNDGMNENQTKGAKKKILCTARTIDAFDITNILVGEMINWNHWSLIYLPVFCRNPPLISHPLETHSLEIQLLSHLSLIQFASVHFHDSAIRWYRLYRLSNCSSVTMLPHLHLCSLFGFFWCMAVDCVRNLLPHPIFMTNDK